MFARLFRLRHLAILLLTLVALALLGLYESLSAGLPAPDALITRASTGTPPYRALWTLEARQHTFRAVAVAPRWEPDS